MAITNGLRAIIDHMAAGEQISLKKHLLQDVAQYLAPERSLWGKKRRDDATFWLCRK